MLISFTMSFAAEKPWIGSGRSYESANKYSEANMDVLITGSDGYIGRHVSKIFPDANLCGKGKAFCDVRGFNGTVIHLAAHSNVAESICNPEKYLRNNALKIAQFLQNNSVLRMILFSTGGGQLYSNRLMAKEADASWSTCMNPYGQSKWMAEEIVKLMVPSYCILRPSNVYGGGNSPVHSHFENDIPIVLYGENQIREFVHIDVVVEAARRAVENRTEGIYNIGSGVGTNLTELAQQYSKRRNVPIRLEPKRLGDILDRISLDCTAARAAGLME